MMDKQEWTTGDTCWTGSDSSPSNIIKATINTIDEEVGEVFCRAGGYTFWTAISNIFPTREAAKAALLEELEQALEEARKL